MPHDTPGPSPSCIREERRPRVRRDSWRSRALPTGNRRKHHPSWKSSFVVLSQPPHKEEPPSTDDGLFGALALCHLLGVLTYARVVVWSVRSRRWKPMFRRRAQALVVRTLEHVELFCAEGLRHTSVKQGLDHLSPRLSAWGRSASVGRSACTTYSSASNRSDPPPEFYHEVSAFFVDNAAHRNRLSMTGSCVYAPPGLRLRWWALEVGMPDPDITAAWWFPSFSRTLWGLLLRRRS